MRLKVPGGIDNAIDALNGVVRELGHVGSGGRDVYLGFLAWWEFADTRFRSIFKDSDLADDLYRSQLWVRQTAPFDPGRDVARRETDVWSEKVQAIIGQLQVLKLFAEADGRIVVPDTSAFIEGKYFTELDWQAVATVDGKERIRLIIPILVIEELDDLKRNPRVSKRARSVLHRLWEMQVGRSGHRAPMPGRNTTAELFLDEPWHVRRPVNDDEITERAVHIQELTGKSVILAAGDYKMLFRAESAGLTTVLVERPDETIEP